MTQVVTTHSRPAAQDAGPGERPSAPEPLSGSAAKPAAPQVAPARRVLSCAELDLLS